MTSWKDLARPDTIVHLSDGFGNQLFQWAAGQFLEQRGHSVLYDTSMAGKGFTQHGHSIERRRLKGKFRRSTAHGRKSRLRRELRRLGRYSRIGLLERYAIRPEFRSEVIGWDEQLKNIDHGTRIFGYFQSYRYVQNSLELELSASNLLPRKYSSPDARDLQARGEKTQPVIIHVRRGDYWKMRNTLGVLESEYFRTALRRVREAGVGAPAIVITDSETEVKEFLDRFDESVELLQIHPGIDPGELLSFMSTGSAHVLSNSYLSWWGAYLAPDSRVIVAPDPWFLDPHQGQPEFLVPPDWIRSEAKFAPTRVKRW